MEKILRRVYGSPRLSLTLKIISHASVLLSVTSYLALLLDSFISDKILALRFAVAGAVPYILVSLARHFINAPRPYELYAFYDRPPKNKRGSSFPSRHVFSAFTVAALSFAASPWLSVAVAVAGLALAVSRVLLGMHFWRDVCAGALIGLASGVLGLTLIVF